MQALTKNDIKQLKRSITKAKNIFSLVTHNSTAITKLLLKKFPQPEAREFIIAKRASRSKKKKQWKIRDDTINFHFSRAIFQKTDK